MSPLVAALPAAPAFLGQLPSADAWLANTTEFADRLLKERKTAVVPGSFFEAPAHFRLGFGAETQTVERGLEQVGAALDEVASGYRILPQT